MDNYLVVLLPNLLLGFYEAVRGEDNVPRHEKDVTN